MEDDRESDEKKPQEAGGKAAGGFARALALSPEERQEIARQAALTRWQIPKATHEATLRIGDVEFDCAVLEDGTRVISQQKFMKAIGLYNSGALSTRRRLNEAGAPVPLFLAYKNLIPFAQKHLGGVHMDPFRYRTLTGNLAHGLKAELIPKICETWIDADRAGVLGPRQKAAAVIFDILLRAFAHVGIVALVDEATGYQEVRDRLALQAILESYLRKELAAWAKRFPDEFYQQIFRLKGWEWRGMAVNRPRIVAQYTKDLVYERLAPGILKELEARNPRDEHGNRKTKHHQWLTEEVGHPALAQHLYAVVGLMRVASSWDQLMNMVNKAFPKRGDTLLLPFMAESG